MINKNLSYYIEADFTENINDNLPAFIEETQLKNGRNWIHISNMVLLDNGYVVIAVVNSNTTNYEADLNKTEEGENSTELEEPTTLKELNVGHYEVKSKELFNEKIERGKGKGSVVGRYIGFYQGIKLSYNFTNLQEHTYYTLFYVATNEDPKYFLERTPIFNTTIKTGDSEIAAYETELVGAGADLLVNALALMILVIYGYI